MRRVHVTAVVMEMQLCFHLCIVIDIHVDVNNAKMLDTAMETQPLVPSGLFPDYRIIRTAVNTINVKINVEHPRAIDAFKQVYPQQITLLFNKKKSYIFRLLSVTNFRDYQYLKIHTDLL